MAYTRVNWENLPSTNTPLNATNLNKMDAGIANAVEKTGDTLTGELLFNNKNDYAAIRKVRTISNVDYGAAVGVGGNGSARMELYQGSNTLGMVEARSDGHIWNGQNNKKLAEQESSSFNITVNTGTLATNVSYKIGNVIGINAKISGVTATAGNGVVLCTLPSGYYNTSKETSLISTVNTGVSSSCWIRTNGQVVLNAYANISNAEVRLIGSFIV